MARPSPRRWLTPIICLLIVLWFVWHGIEGKYGAKTRAMLLEEMVVMEAELANIRKQQKILERNIGLMQPQGLDPDMLSEQAGRILGMMHPDERQYK